MMRSILCTNKYENEPLGVMEKELPDGFELKFLEEQTEECLKDSVADIDYILAGGRLHITDEVLNSATNLKMVQRTGVGLDTLDLKALERRRIPLYVNKGVNAQSVAEHTLMLFLACLRKLNIIDKNSKKGIWKKQEQGLQTHELCGKTVGIIGMGEIARTLVSLLQPFHVRILYYSHFRMESSFEQEKGMEKVSLNELLNSSDIISIHCSLRDDTRNLINWDNICKIKTGAVLVNTARGNIVDEDALTAALINGRIAYAGIDVHAMEPFKDNYPLRELDNVILTPHIAGVTADSFSSMMHQAFYNIKCFEEGRLEEIEFSRYGI